MDFLAAEFPLFLHFVGYKSADKTYKSHKFCRQKIHTQLFPTVSNWFMLIFSFFFYFAGFAGFSDNLSICCDWCIESLPREESAPTVSDCFQLFPTVSRWIIFIFWGCCAICYFLFLFVERCFCLTVSQFDLIISTLFRNVLSWPQQSGLAIFQMDFWSYFGHKALFLYYSKHGALGTTQQSSNFAWTLNS